MINRKKQRITIKLHFENLSIFFKKNEHTHMLGPPPSIRFCSLFNDHFSSPQRMCYLNDPYEIDTWSQDLNFDFTLKNCYLEVLG